MPRRSPRAEAGDTLQVIGTCHGNWDIDKDLTITGRSSNQHSDKLIGDPTATGAILQVDPYSWGTAIDLAVKNLTITGGVNGAIRGSDGTLTVIDSVITGNHSGYGGGGIDSSGPLLVTDSIVSDNSANLKNGGIATYGSGDVTLINTTVTGNTAHSNGGIGPVGHTLTLINSTVSNNVATNDFAGFNFGDKGGGIWVSPGGHADLINSTVAGNSNLGIQVITENGDFWWLGHGGGIYNGGVVTLTDSVVTDNTAFTGGGIYNDITATVVLNGTSSVFGNTPDDIAP